MKEKYRALTGGGEELAIMKFDDKGISTAFYGKEELNLKTSEINRDEYILFARENFSRDKFEKFLEDTLPPEEYADFLKRNPPEDR